MYLRFGVNFDIHVLSILKDILNLKCSTLDTGVYKETGLSYYHFWNYICTIMYNAVSHATLHVLYVLRETNKLKLKRQCLKIYLSMGRIFTSYMLPLKIELLNFYNGDVNPA